jgi:ABC-2 type transport system ATP-binding protein
LLKNLAAAGRTIFVSSHLMSEMALTAEHLIVIGRGRIIADMSVEAFIDQVSSNEVRVRTPQVAQFSRLLEISGANVVHGEADALAVSGLSSAAIGELAATNAVILHELSPQEPSLEEAFLELTRDAVQYHGHAEAALVGARQRGEG